MTLLTLIALTGCRNDKDLLDSGWVDTGPVDLDEDGLNAAEDCDDADPEVGAASDWYADSDGDGYGSGDPTSACEAPSGHVADASDCDDADAAIHPNAEEEDCTDPVDYNCDGSVGYADEDEDGYPACEDCDDADPAANEELTFYTDADGDGFGEASAPVSACELPEGAADDATDCDDTDDTIHPGATELCDGLDNDCDSAVSAEEEDDDSDGFVECAVDDDGWDGDAITGGEDCDDSRDEVFPGAEELCDGLDNDCDGALPDDEADQDNDTYVACTITTWSGSSAVVAGEDCDDDNSAVNPGADELCSTTDDDDCDGTVNEDDAVDASTWYADTDGDGYGDPTVTTVACDVPSGTVSDDTDCDDGDGDVHPGATETCNGTDDDCDTDIDEGLLGTGASCAADDCMEVLTDGQTVDGSYTLYDAAGTSTFSAYCDLSTDGGGWTLIGSVVNEASVSGSHARSWDSYAVWTDTTTFGSITDRNITDYKGEAFSETAGDDVLIITDEYGFGFDGVVGGQAYADHIVAEYDPNNCNSTLQASGADYYDTITATEALALVYIIRPLDSNAQCFPTTNENALVGLQLASCCWAGGLGNTPGGQASWKLYDNSLLDSSHLGTSTCSAGVYPCNDDGLVWSQFTYTYDSKVTWAEIYVR